MRQLRLGSILLSVAMNGFYGTKRLRGNLPVNMQVRQELNAWPTAQPGGWQSTFDSKEVDEAAQP